MNEFELVTNPRGYTSVHPLPSESQLEDYYREKYWQSPTRPHTVSYSDQERNYRLNRNRLTLHLLPRNHNVGSALDVGCGEGFMLKSLEEFGYQAKGIDVSSFGVSSHNPECLELVTTGSIPEILSNLLHAGQTFDLVLLTCVLEHVRDPDALLELVGRLVRVGGYLIVSVPNDFSWLQSLVGHEVETATKHWVSPPDHLHYFNKQALINVVSEHGFTHIRSISDFPIEVFLLNEFSNYVSEGLKGKSAHEARIVFENELFDEYGSELVNHFWESCSNIGLGRTITSVFRLDK